MDSGTVPIEPPVPDELPRWRQIDRTAYRLSLPFNVRLPLSLTASFLTGFVLGTTHGGTMSGLRFRAEHAHRLPENSAGWYLYHKSKNYHVMWGGLKEGAKMGGKISLWAGIYFSAEEAVDISRGGSKDFLSSVVASLATAGAFSLWSEFRVLLPAYARSLLFSLCGDRQSHSV